jgi:hypothetical protein
MVQDVKEAVIATAKENHAMTVATLNQMKDNSVTV